MTLNDSLNFIFWRSKRVNNFYKRLTVHVAQRFVQNNPRRHFWNQQIFNERFKQLDHWTGFKNYQKMIYQRVVKSDEFINK